MVTLENISKQHGSEVLFREVNVAFTDDGRTGLIGINGSGKTTILRMVASIESPDSGSIRTPSSMTIGYLPQEVETLQSSTPLEIVLEPFAKVLNYEESLQSMGQHLEGADGATLRRLQSLYDDMAFHDVFSLRARAESILAGLGVPQDRWNRPVETLSGGYRMRTVLGRILLTAPDYLLLDEPTNHLDMDSLVWLERFLSRYKGGMLIVSHDRDFLNRMCTHTAQISGQTLTLYRGNYDSFVSRREEIEQAEASRLRNLQLRIAHAERFVERFKAKATKAAQAQSRVKMLDALKAELPDSIPVQATREMRFTLPLPKPRAAHRSG